MADREVYRVVPGDNQWAVKSELDAAPLATYAVKELAVYEAKRRAKAARLGQVKVEREDNTIEVEYTYGDDPRGVPG